MLYLCCYDIVSDRCRTKVATTLENIGLERIQYSVFVGSLTYAQKRLLLKQIKQIIGNEQAHVLLIPFSFPKNKDGLTHIGTSSPDWNYLAKKVNTLIL